MLYALHNTSLNRASLQIRTRSRSLPSSDKTDRIVSAPESVAPAPALNEVHSAQFTLFNMSGIEWSSSLCALGPFTPTMMSKAGIITYTLQKSSTHPTSAGTSRWHLTSSMHSSAGIWQPGFRSLVMSNWWNTGHFLHSADSAGWFCGWWWENNSKIRSKIAKREKKRRLIHRLSIHKDQWKTKSRKQTNKVHVWSPLTTSDWETE